MKPRSEDTKKILERAGRILETIGLDDGDWYLPAEPPPAEAGNGEGHWVAVQLFVPKRLKKARNGRTR